MTISGAFPPSSVVMGMSLLPACSDKSVPTLVPPVKSILRIVWRFYQLLCCLGSARQDLDHAIWDACLLRHEAELEHGERSHLAGLDNDAVARCKCCRELLDRNQ